MGPKSQSKLPGKTLQKGADGGGTSSGKSLGRGTGPGADPGPGRGRGRGPGRGTGPGKGASPDRGTRELELRYESNFLNHELYDGSTDGDAFQFVLSEPLDVEAKLRATTNSSGVDKAGVKQMAQCDSRCRHVACV